MKKCSFVIVDDSLFMRMLLKKAIEENESYKVVGEGANGYDAIEQAEKNKPDIMTLDVTMPVLNGIRAIPEILKASPKTRIIIISAMGQQHMVVEAIKLGARDFVIKPFEKSRLMQAIKNVIH